MRNRGFIPGMLLNVGASCESRSSRWDLTSGKLRVLEKFAEVMEHHIVPGTNHLKLCFEFAKHCSHLFWALAATLAGSDRCFGVGWFALCCTCVFLSLVTVLKPVTRITLKPSCHGVCILLSKEQSLFMPWLCPACCGSGRGCSAD